MSIQVKGLTIGQGKPKICLPIVGKNDEEIFQIVKDYERFHFDLLELRIDFYEKIKDLKAVENLLKKVSQITDKPLLFTYRSLREGGQIQLSDDEYLSLISKVSQLDEVDLIDIELMSGKMLVYQLVEKIHQNNKYVIMSYHHFQMTPSLKELQEYLETMEILNADILKLAVMPQTPQDVLNLMTLTRQMSDKINRPLVTMSMGKLGTISRISGELTGSAMTFASGGKASAPGQINVADMNTFLEVLHLD